MPALQLEAQLPEHEKLSVLSAAASVYVSLWLRMTSLRSTLAAGLVCHENQLHSWVEVDRSEAGTISAVLSRSLDNWLIKVQLEGLKPGCWRQQAATPQGKQHLQSPEQ